MSRAVISDCGTYRYMLERGQGSFLPIVMLNPSTADAEVDDPTIRRCKSFATAFGYTGIIVLNLYAFRATQPANLWTADDPVGPANNAWLLAIATHPEILCAWGANARPDRVSEVASILNNGSTKLKCLGMTKHGAPRHPLYVKGDQPLIDWEFK